MAFGGRKELSVIGIDFRQTKADFCGSARKPLDLSVNQRDSEDQNHAYAASSERPDTRRDRCGARGVAG
jgi:hypothetical protein